MSTLFQLLLEICRDQGIEHPRNRDIQDLVGITSGRVTQIKQEGEAASLSEDKMARLVDLGYRRAWVKRGVGPSRISAADLGPDTWRPVPLLSWVQAGSWSAIVHHLAPGDAEEWIPCPIAHGPRTYVLRVRGESMYNPHGRPSFFDGDLIFVDPDRDAIQGSLVIVRLDDEDEAVFKQLVVEGSRRYLRAINPAWPAPILPIDRAATLCGVVILRVEKI
jgi:SOS-response transcriptional repressor LexA